jgi:hypothetical protein
VVRGLVVCGSPSLFPTALTVLSSTLERASGYGVAAPQGRRCGRSRSATWSKPTSATAWPARRPAPTGRTADRAPRPFDDA